MNKKTVLKAAGLFVAGLAGGIGIMLSNDAYKAVNDALGQSTSNALSIAQQSLAAQQALTSASQQRQEQLGKIVQDADALKKQADTLSQQQKTGAIGSGVVSGTQATQKDQEKDKSAEASQQEQQKQQQQQELQQQLQQMITQIQQMLQQIQQSEMDAMRKLTKA